MFEVTNTKLHLVKVVTINPFEWCSATIINAWLNKDDTRLCFSYSDSVLFVYDFKLSITCSVKTAFVSIIYLNLMFNCYFPINYYLRNIKKLKKCNYCLYLLKQIIYRNCIMLRF